MVIGRSRLSGRLLGLGFRLGRTLTLAIAILVRFLSLRLAFLHGGVRVVLVRSDALGSGAGGRHGGAASWRCGWGDQVGANAFYRMGRENGCGCESESATDAVAVARYG